MNTATLHPNDPHVQRAEAIIFDVLRTPSHEELVELYAPLLWEHGTTLAYSSDDELQRYAYITLLLAISKTPGVAPADTLTVAAQFITDEMATFIEAWASRHVETAAPDPDLDAKVRPLLAWLDA